MENCTIYSHEIDFDSVINIVKTNLPNASVEVFDLGQQKGLVATIKGGFFSKNKVLKVNYRQRENPSYKLDAIECGLTQNLAGMVNFIQSIPTQNAGLRDKFLHKVMAVNSEIPFIAEPSLNSDFVAVLQQIVAKMDAFIFTEPNSVFKKSNAIQFLDSQFNLIIDTNGKSELTDLDVNINAAYFDAPATSFSEEQLARKTQSEAFLQSKGVKINKNLPCVADSSTVQIRNVEEVIKRVYALMVISVKGEGVEQGALERVVNDKQIDSFTPNELAVYQANTLDDQTRANAVWRYESLNMLLWALGKNEDLGYPSDICNVQYVVSTLLHTSRTEFERSVQLKSIKEILDELDKTYRMNWACVDARIKGQQVGGNLNASVVYERHYALNWLTTYLNQDWDDVQTHT